MGRAKRLKVEKLGAKLRWIRESLGLTQSELIKELRCEHLIYQANVSEYELNKREPPLPILLGYARLCGVSTDDLIDDKIDLAL
jgi:transcriptional regulator with XRE-family HTH domain